MSFSTSTNRGRTMRMILSISYQRPDLDPCRPAPLPAGDMSWQGEPAGDEIHSIELMSRHFLYVAVELHARVSFG